MISLTRVDKGWKVTDVEFANDDMNVQVEVSLSDAIGVACQSELSWTAIDGVSAS